MSDATNGTYRSPPNHDDEGVIFQRSPTSTERQEGLCGIRSCAPSWLQGLANARMYLAVHAAAGIVQSMIFSYFIAVITTIEKRFKFPSKTTGIVMAGNEVSQIALGLFLTYYAGQGHRPRWLAMGMMMSALSCFILALPHLVYGSGKDALKAAMVEVDRSVIAYNSTEQPVHLCDRQDSEDGSSLANSTMTVSETTKCEEDIGSIVPLVLIFLANFVGGIGITLYYTVGTTYLDDNVKKSQSPYMFGINYGIRMVGPTLGFLLSSATLKMFVNPTIKPDISEKDPQWIGAWWLGFLVIGILMSFMAFLMSCFPRYIPRKHEKLQKQGDMMPLKKKGTLPPPVFLKRGLKEFPATLRKLLSNKVFMCNNAASVCYILGIVGWWTFLPKYMESQYRTTATEANLAAGITGIVVMALGLLMSGIVISRFQPRARTLAAWDVFVSLLYVISQIVFTQIGCTGPRLQGDMLQDGTLSIANPCNIDCACSQVKFSPVCYTGEATTFYSACHAGCITLTNEISSKKMYKDCGCIVQPGITNMTSLTNSSENANITFALPNMLLSNQSSVMSPFEINGATEILGNMATLYTSSSNRSVLSGVPFVEQGWCSADCYQNFLFFIVVMSFMKFMGSTGRLGNLLVGIRCVNQEDKSIALGFTTMLISILGFIPSPIIYGAIVDTTCLVWEEACGERGNCWLYDSEKLRINIHVATALFIALGTFFDGLVWYHVKNLQLYKEPEEIEMDVIKK